MKLVSRKIIIAALLAGTGLAFTLPATAQEQAPTTDQPGATAPATPPQGGKRGAMTEGRGFGFAIAQFDSNGDGQVTLEEIQAKRAADAAALDGDGDGMISKDELVAFELAKEKSRIEARVNKRFEAQDSNGDGMLSAAELIERPLPTQLFERLDRNNDGAVSAQEMQAARKMMRDRMERHDRRGEHGKKGEHRHMGKGGKMGDRDGHGPQNGPNGKRMPAPQNQN